MRESRQGGRFTAASTLATLLSRVRTLEPTMRIYVRPPVHFEVVWYEGDVDVLLRAHGLGDDGVALDTLIVSLTTTRECIVCWYYTTYSLNCAQGSWWCDRGGASSRLFSLTPATDTPLVLLLLESSSRPPPLTQTRLRCTLFSTACYASCRCSCMLFLDSRASF